MSSHRLSNYLRSSRKRLALSQEEVAFLMGKRGGTKICRYERFLREPNLKTALAFEIIYGKPVSELFAGVREKLAQEIGHRAKIMSHRVNVHKSDKRSQRKKATVTALINS